MLPNNDHRYALLQTRKKKLLRTSYALLWPGY